MNRREAGNASAWFGLQSKCKGLGEEGAKHRSLPVVWEKIRKGLE